MTIKLPFRYVVHCVTLFLMMFSMPSSAQQLQAMLEEGWANGEWHNSALTSYNYDSNAFLTQSVFQLWNSPPDAFTDQARKTYTNNDQGLPIEEVNEFHNPDTSNWDLTQRFTSTYNAAGQILIYQRELFENDVWNVVSREINEYDGNGQKISLTTQTWIAATSSWVDFDHVIYTYNADGNLQTVLIQGDATRYVYEYNANEQPIIMTIQQWNANDNYWMNGQKAFYVYNELNQLLNEQLQVWFNGEWTDYSRLFFTYNTDGSPSQEVNQRHTAGWVNDQRKRYIYSSLAASHFNKVQLVLYPNPATDHITIKGGVAGTDYSISDAMGRMVASGKLHETDERINVEQLTAGIYLINAGDSTIKIIKE
jgi:hypothetical protein